LHQRFRSAFQCVILLICLFGVISNAQENSNLFFSKTINVSYRIHYGFIDAGVLECVTDTNSFLIESHKCFKMAITGRTTGAAAAFAKINDRWITYVDSSTGYPFRFVRELQENNYSKEELTEFDRTNSTAVVSNKTEKDEYNVTTHNTTPDAYDMVSAYLHLHSIKFNKLVKNDTIRINVFLEDSTFRFQIRYLGKEKIKTKYGKRHSYKISPIMPENSIFSKEEAIICWLSADNDKIPLKLRAKLVLGAIEMDLENYSGYNR
jgi:hypothetical protein